MLNAARLVESRSTHPIARAIMKTAPGSHGFALEAVESKEIPGKGLSAEHKGRTLLVGNALLLQDAGISVPSLPAGQGSVVYVAVGNAYLGAIEVSDVLRPESAPAIESLRREGIERLVMLTGDRPESAPSSPRNCISTSTAPGCSPKARPPSWNRSAPGSPYFL